VIRIAAATIWVLFGAWASAADHGHLDNPMLPEGCGSCHVGHGLSNEPMLARAEEDFCYQCHGTEDDAAAMRSAGRLSPLARPAQIESAFDKPYRHPVERKGDHRPDERLPQLATGDSQRHAECVDCHSPHTRGNEAGRRRVTGYSVTGSRVDDAASEYEVCFKCHSDDILTEGRQRNLRLLMGPTARSSHPVAIPYTGSVSPSLTSGTTGALMKCSDCHGNDDRDGPRGPHGSAYPGLLVDRYETSPLADESPYAYALCYRCHDRASILGNESFPYHRQHIVGDPAHQIPGTSCATCHNTHGSLEAAHLIDFNPEAVGPSGISPVRYVDLGNGHGECYLLCHNKSHDPARY